MGKLVEMNRSGDVERDWRADDELSVAKVMARFDELIGSGHVAYTVDKDGVRKQIKAFDKNAEEIITNEQLIGG